MPEDPLLNFPSSRRINESLLAALSDWESRVFKAAERTNPELSGRLKFRQTVPLDVLPKRMREDFMHEYRGIIQFDETLERLVGGPMLEGGVVGAERIAQSEKLRWQRQRIPGENAFARLGVRMQGESVLGHIYSQMNIQWRPPFQGGTAFEHFGIGTTRIPTTKAIRQNVEVYRRSQQGKELMEKGAKYMVFDIETAGLDFGQIREVAYSSGVVGQGGALPGGKRASINFRVAEFNRGMLADRGMPMQIEEFMKKTHGIDYSDMKYGSGDEFVEKLMPFLRQMNESKYILGHNISGFDIQQIFVGLSGTRAYHRNDLIAGVRFRDFVDETYNTLDSKIVDTLALARSLPNLRGITTAPEILARGGSELFSIENILLQTDILSRDPTLRRLIGGGGALHLAGIDTQITERLAELLPTLRTSRRGRLIDTKLRRAIASSAAITPITNIRSLAQVSDLMLEHMIMTGEGVKNVSPDVQTAMDSIRASTNPQKEVRSLIQDLRNGKGDFFFNVNPIEQEIFHTRDLDLRPLQNVATDDILMSLGAFDRMTGRNIPYQGVLRKDFHAMRRLGWAKPSIPDWTQFQQRLARAGIPYAGLSYEERRLGTAMSVLTSGLAKTDIERKIAAVGADALVSRFETFNLDTIQYASARTPRASIPLHLLGGIDPDFADPLKAGRSISLGFSPFDYPIEEVGREVSDRRFGVNLVYNLSDTAEAERFAAGVEDIASRTDEEIAKVLDVDLERSTGKRAVERFKQAAPALAERLRSETAMRYGISVGQIYTNQSLAQKVGSLIRETRGGVDADDGTLAIRAQLIGAQDGTIQVGAPTIGRFAPPDQSMVRMAGEAAQFLETRIKPIVRTARTSVLADSILRLAQTDEAAQRILRISDVIQNKVIPRITARNIGIGALIGAGYYMYQRKEEQDQYDVALQQMPFERGTDYSIARQVEMRMAAGKTSAQKMDPLATAPIVDNLYMNRVGHTSMAWDRNTALYGGVL